MAGADADPHPARSGHNRVWLQLFLGMLRIGATAFGGGSATIVAMRRLVIRKGWLTEEEFLDTVVLSRVTPGITILAQVFLIGKRVDGARGIAVALVGMLLPSITITIALARLYTELQDKPWSQRPLALVAAVAAGFAVALALMLLKDVLAVGSRWRGALGFSTYVAAGAMLPNPVLILLAAVVLGLAMPTLFVDDIGETRDAD